MCGITHFRLSDRSLEQFTCDPAPAGQYFEVGPPIAPAEFALFEEARE